MAPQKFPSVRHKSRPAARLATFRDDSGLIALRYEQTKQAEPPIPLPPPRNPLRTTTITARRLSTSGSVVPVAITIVPPSVPPPREQHPFFRTQPSPPESLSRSSPATQTDEWKRDSGLARSASSATLRDEYEEDVVYQKILDDIADAPSIYSGDEQSPTSDTPSPIFDHHHPVPIPAPLNLPKVPQSPVSPISTVDSPLEPLPSPTPTRASSLTKKFGLGKTFSIRSAGKRRLRKKSVSMDNLNVIRNADNKVASASASAAPDKENNNNAGTGTSPDTPRPRPARSSTSSKMKNDAAAGQSRNADSNFIPITTSIPEESLWEDFNDLSFSKRGSLMFGGKSDPLALFGKGKSGASSTQVPADPPSDPTQAADDSAADPATPAAATEAARLRPRAQGLEESPSVPSIRVVSMDVERESQKVRSLYESGEDLDWRDGGRNSYSERLAPTKEVPSDEEENVVASPSAGAQSDIPSTNDQPATPSPPGTTPRPAHSSLPPRDKPAGGHERAGGLEDWEDVESGDVDRYGFISPRRPESSRAVTPEARTPHLSPVKKRNVLTKRPGSAYTSSPHGLRPPSRKVSARSLNTFASDISTLSRRSTRSSIRSATNRLPHNRDRRWMDEAGDMLALEPGLAGVLEDSKTGKAAEAARRKETERTEKWRKMAKVINQAEQVGHGMEFEFDTKNPKLIERTWKGIPDCWRAAAWHSFLVTSARNWKDMDTDEHLMAEFRRLQDVASPDDVQIDLDVPRTINRHIMFRRRYRGGQRLLFRVLHAISLYFPETGYVQGMASLAATLLCYYDEERCFVMMVRLWRFRGLEHLYEPGFAGLMAALGDFEKRWLAGKDVADKLNELSIDATAYGTRWYLTLFNLSIPFPAQLRVWDVFMLMGECPPESSTQTSPPPRGAAHGKAAEGSGDGNPKARPSDGLDILHATSAALIHALRDVLLDSDFENAMKALTAWIPVKDEDLLMKVARAEWRQHQGDKRKEKA